MVRKKVIEEVDPNEIDESEAAVPEAEASTEEAAEAAAPTKDFVTIVIVKRQNDGPQVGFERTFSKQQHGKDYKKNAQQYAEHFGGEAI